MRRRAISSVFMRQPQRQMSGVLAPASCSFRMPMICSFVKRLPFIMSVSCATDSTSNLIHLRGTGQKPRSRCMKRHAGLGGLVPHHTFLEGRKDFQLSPNNSLLRYSRSGHAFCRQLLFSCLIGNEARICLRIRFYIAITEDTYSE